MNGYTQCRNMNEARYDKPFDAFREALQKSADVWFLTKVFGQTFRGGKKLESGSLASRKYFGKP